jgi:hypothetical protein
MTRITPATQTGPKDTTDLYDALTLELERAEILTAHLAEQLRDRSEDGALYALALVAEAIHEKHARIRLKAQALLSAGPAAAESGGGR